MRLLTLARDLKRRKAREREGLFVAEGIRAVEELLRSPLETVGLLCAPKLAESPRGAALRAAAMDRGIQLADVSDREFMSAAETESPQGIVGIAKVPQYDLSGLAGRTVLRLLVLDAVQDPGNVGTIVRTAAALGADATIALSGTVDLWNAKVVRSAMGAHFHAAAFHAPWEEVAAFLAREQGEIWVADVGGDEVSGGVPPRLAIVVGNEGGGVSEQVRTAAQRIVSIRISSAVESLNVAVAAGILLYQVRT